MEGHPERVRDQRIEQVVPLQPPTEILDELPLTRRAGGRPSCAAARRSSTILRRADDRLLVVVGPCSVHDVDAAPSTPTGSRSSRPSCATTCCLAMRVYFEKPRTTTGWKGMINDPHLDGSGDVNAGPPHGARAAARGALARAAHRQRVPRPDHAAVHLRRRRVGGDRRAHHREPDPPPASRRACRCRSASRTARPATSASRWTPSRAAASPHAFTGVTLNGTPAILHTRGQRRCARHPAGRARGAELRRSRDRGTLGALRAAGLPRARRDRRVARQQRQGPQPPAGRSSPMSRSRSPTGNEAIVGVMLESFLVDGRQDLEPGHAARVRPVDHRRLHGLGDDDARARPARGRRTSAARGAGR